MIYRILNLRSKHFFRKNVYLILKFIQHFFDIYKFKNLLKKADNPDLLIVS